MRGACHHYGDHHGPTVKAVDPRSGEGQWGGNVFGHGQWLPASLRTAFWPIRLLFKGFLGRVCSREFSLRVLG